jgi:radical SAM superfamily enzyme YgiQ (UPF0313 family)
MEKEGRRKIRMNNYIAFPPLKYFMRVLKSCPKSALLYTQIWKNKSKRMNIVTAKKDIRKDYLISPTIFRNLLAPLMYLNLIHFIESDDKFQIDISGAHTND